MKTRGNRNRLFLATKVGFGYDKVEMGLSARQIETECDKSLKRLGVRLSICTTRTSMIAKRRCKRR